MEQTIDYKGYKIRILIDDDPESPNEWGDDSTFLVYDHRQFMVKRDGFEPRDIWGYFNGEDASMGFLYEDYYIFPVEAYIHSGVKLSLYEADLTCRFDSSVTGFVLVKSKVESMAGIKFITESMAKKRAESLLEIWNQYLSGEIYGFIIEKPNVIYSITKKKFDRLVFENDLANLESEFDVDHIWEEIDSCWGFYGDPEESGCIDEAKFIIDKLTKDD